MTLDSTSYCLLCTYAHHKILNLGEKMLMFDCSEFAMAGQLVSLASCDLQLLDLKGRTVGGSRVSGALFVGKIGYK